MGSGQDRHAEDTEHMANTRSVDADYARALAHSAAQNAVRAAEAVIGEAWTCRLEQVRGQSEAELHAATRDRDRVRDRLERCRATGDDPLVGEAEAELAAAELAVVRVATENALLDGYVTRELRTLDQARSARIDAAVAEERALRALPRGAAARAAAARHDPDPDAAG